MKTLCALLIEDDPDYAALVERWIATAAKPSEFVLHWTDSLAAALARLDLGGVDVVLMDLGLPDSHGPDSFAAVRGKAADLPIVILSGADDENVALQLIQRGAQDYLIKHNCSADLLVHTLRYTVVRHQAIPRTAGENVKPQARVIGVVGASGGAGTTTIASTLAIEMAAQTEQSTLLIDLDLSPGLVAFTCGFEPEYSVQDALEHADRIDASIWDGIVVRRPGNFDILASVPSASPGEFDANRTRRLLDFIVGTYRWVVMDLGRLNAFSKQAAGWADDLILVTTPAIPALHQCKHAIETLDGAGVGRDRIRLILNRTDASLRLSSKEIQQIFGIDIDATLHPAHGDLYQACMKKELPSATCDFRETLSGVARKLAGLPDARGRSLLGPLLAITDKLRHLGDTALR